MSLLYEPPHHLLDVRPWLFGGVGVHRHPGHPLVDAAAAGPADVQRRDLGVGHLGPVGGVDPGVRAGGRLGLLLLPGLRVTVRVVLVKRFPDECDLLGGEEVLDVVLFEAHLEGSVPVLQQLLQGRPLLLAVVKLRFALRDLLVDVLIVQAPQLGLRHVLLRCSHSHTAVPERTGTAGAQVRLSGKEQEAGPATVWKSTWQLNAHHETEIQLPVVKLSK